MPDPTAEFTGERVIPGEVDPDLFNEHFARYSFAKRFAEYKSVLDIGCGSGYGAALLAEAADRCTAIDASAEAVAYARERFSRSNLIFEQADASEPPSGPFEIITAFEVIEHLEDWQGMLAQARQRLTHGGLFFVSTPNKPLYAEARGEAGRNPFHVHEFEYQEFSAALHAHFPHVQMFVQNHAAGVLFSPVSGPASKAVGLEAALAGQNVDLAAAGFFLAVCSATPVREWEHYFWLPSTANLLRERERHIALLKSETALRTGWHEAARAELAQRNGEYEALLTLHAQLEQDLKARNEWALRQNEELAARGHRIEALQLEVETAHQEFARTAAAYEARSAELEASNAATAEWARETERRLTAELEQRTAQLTEHIELLHSAERLTEERTAWAQALDRELLAAQQRYTGLRRAFWVRLGSRLHLLSDPG